MTNAQALTRKVALEILKAYHREIKSGFIADASAVERERAQSKAFEAAADQLKKISDRYEIESYPDSSLFHWLNSESDEEVYE